MSSNRRRIFSGVCYDGNTIVRPHQPNLIYFIVNLLYKSTMVVRYKIIILTIASLSCSHQSLVCQFLISWLRHNRKREKKDITTMIYEHISWGHWQRSGILSEKLISIPKSESLSEMWKNSTLTTIVWFRCHDLVLKHIISWNIMYSEDILVRN